MSAKLFLLIVLVAALALLAGCADDDFAQDAATTRPSDAALNDPANYHPHITKEEMDITGGGTDHLDKAALKRDWDHVLNP